MTRKRWMVIGGVALAAVVASSVGWSMRDDLTYATLATGYAAKQTCSCRHVSGRDMSSCMADFPEDARSQIAVAEDGDRIRASVLFGAISAEALYEEGYGCRLLN